jgi:hypothetical protein
MSRSLRRRSPICAARAVDPTMSASRTVAKHALALWHWDGFRRNRVRFRIARDEHNGSALPQAADARGDLGRGQRRAKIRSLVASAMCRTKMHHERELRALVLRWRSLNDTGTVLRWRMIAASTATLKDFTELCAAI